MTMTIRFRQGTTHILPFRVESDTFGDDVDLSGATIAWELRREGQTVLTLDSPGVSLQNRDDSDGTFEIRLEATATTLRTGTYTDVVTITDTDGNVTKHPGRIRIQPV